MLGTPVGSRTLITRIVIEIARLSGRVSATEDKLFGYLKLSSASWQVLRSIALAKEPASAPQVADAVGITRQGAQKHLNRLVGAGFVEPRHNARNKRSPVYVLTSHGCLTYENAVTLQRGWVGRLAKEFSEAELQGMCSVLERLSQQLARLGNDRSVSVSAVTHREEGDSSYF